ncbi:hypothetical protein E3U43_001453 [Larimichthys crocea]|uniref:Uncharacterized protein n=1 Tax=Larimichthys crocea TaxID=215358 RepID=A0ACD3RD28_LARCR|nr:hypothetical protein E3U43_001453 [Larimichthys crocea]
MERGLFGELSIQPVTLLTPCPSTFFQNLPNELDCQELGLHSLHCSLDHANSGATVYSAKQENLQDSEQELSLPSVQQTLLLFLFLQHSDPFTCHLSDSMATEALIEHHLEGILSNNRQAVTTALQTELKNALKGPNRGKKASA